MRRCSALHQIDEPQVPRPEHDDLPVGDVVLGALLRGAPGGLPDRVARHRLLLVTARDPGDLTAGQRSLHQLVEAVSVSLFEGRALCLSVIGEHDDLVRAAGVSSGPLDAPELLVELAERLHRVGPLEPGVVRHLVVARKRGVDGGPAEHHVGEHAVGDQVPHDNAHRRPQQRIDASAVPPRAHVASRGPDRRGDLEQNLPAEQDERPGDVEAVGEERAVSGVGPPLYVHAADRQDDLVGLAREQVASAGAAVHQEPGAGRVPTLDLGAVRGRRARDQHPGLLLHPPERGDVLVGPEQDARLAGPRLRGEVGLPLVELVAVVRQPARHRRRASVPHRVLEYREGEPVDLQEDDSRDVRRSRRSLAARDPLDDPKPVIVLIIRAGHDLERDRDGGDHQCREEGTPERVDVDCPGKGAVRDEQRRRVDREDQDEPGGDREREPKRRHDRRQHSVEDRDRRRHEQRAAELLEPDARDEPGGHVDGDRRHDPRDDQPDGLQARLGWLPSGRSLAVGGRGHDSGAPSVRRRARRSAVKSRLLSLASP